MSVTNFQNSKCKPAFPAKKEKNLGNPSLTKKERQELSKKYEALCKNCISKLDAGDKELGNALFDLVGYGSLEEKNLLEKYGIDALCAKILRDVASTEFGKVLKRDLKADGDFYRF